MNELILVVDDEPKIVKLARDYLEQSGFRVAEALLRSIKTIRGEASGNAPTRPTVFSAPSRTGEDRAHPWEVGLPNRFLINIYLNAFRI